MNMAPARSAPRRPIWIALALAVLTFLLYARTATFSFVNLDDPVYVSGNPHVREGLTRSNILWALTANPSADWNPLTWWPLQDYASNWHPLTWLSLQSDAQLGPGSLPAVCHLHNVFLHAASTALLFLLLVHMTGALGCSALVAVLFAWHPLHVESVAWIAERKDVLSTFFGMLALLAYAWYAAAPSLGRSALVAVALALSLLAKPMLVTLPGVLLLLDFWPLRRLQGTGAPSALRRTMGPPAPADYRPGRKQITGLVLEKIPLCALSVASCMATWYAQARGGALAGLEHFGLIERAENALVAYVTYLGKLVYPTGLTAFYPFPSAAPPAWQVAGAAGLLVGLSIATWIVRVRCPYLLVGWLWYLGTLVPVIGLIQVGTQALADRYTYFPSIGIFVALVWGGAALAQRMICRRLAIGVASGLAVGCALLTWVQIGYWRDSVTLWSHALDVDPYNARAHVNLAAAVASDDLDRAIRHDQRAVQIAPRYGAAHYDLALALARRRQYAAAVPHFEAALELGVANPAQIHNQLGAALEQAGRTQEALEHYRQAVAFNPGLARAHYNLGRLLAARDPGAAAYHLREALRIDSTNGAARQALDQLHPGSKAQSPDDR